MNAYEELFAGYKECPAEVLDRTFSEIGGYDDLVLVRDIPFYSHCEHHVMPFIGKAHIAYVPTGRVVGLSKIARLIDVYARRLQTQEHLTAQIATAIEEILKPRGAAVMLEAEHTCMSMRGVRSRARPRVTTKFTGLFDDPQEQVRFITMVRGGALTWIARRREPLRVCRAGLGRRGRGGARVRAEIRRRRAGDLRDRSTRRAARC